MDLRIAFTLLGRSFRSLSSIPGTSSREYLFPELACTGFSVLQSTERQTNEGKGEETLFLGSQDVGLLLEFVEVHGVSPQNF